MAQRLALLLLALRPGPGGNSSEPEKDAGPGAGGAGKEKEKEKVGAGAAPGVAQDPCRGGNSGSIGGFSGAGRLRSLALGCTARCYGIARFLPLSPFLFRVLLPMLVSADPARQARIGRGGGG